MPSSRFTCEDFRRWSLELDNKARRPYSRSLSRHELTCLSCVEWMRDRMRKALADHESGVLRQSPEHLTIIDNILAIVSRRAREYANADRETVDCDASQEAEPTLSDLANIEVED